MDDIIITGSNDQEHWKNFKKVVATVQDIGLHIQPEKITSDSKFREMADAYLQVQVRPVQAIQDLTRPKSVDEVQAFLRKVGYYTSFIPTCNLSSKAVLLNILRRKGAHFSWINAHENLFQEIKKTLIQETCLTLRL